MQASAINVDHNDFPLVNTILRGLTMQKQRIAALTLLCLFSAVVGENSARAALITVNFDAIDAVGQGNGVGGATLSSYLAAFGITVANVTPGTQPVVFDSRSIYPGLEPVVPSSPHNVLAQVGSNSAMSYDLVFDRLLDDFSFTRTAIRAGGGIALPAWNVRAFNSGGIQIAVVGESRRSIFQNIPAVTHTFGRRRNRVDPIRIEYEQLCSTKRHDL